MTRNDLPRGVPNSSLAAELRGAKAQSDPGRSDAQRREGGRWKRWAPRWRTRLNEPLDRVAALSPRDQARRASTPPVRSGAQPDAESWWKGRFTKPSASATSWSGWDSTVEVPVRRRRSAVARGREAIDLWTQSSNTTCRGNDGASRSALSRQRPFDGAALARGAGPDHRWRYQQGGRAPGSGIEPAQTSRRIERISWESSGPQKRSRPGAHDSHRNAGSVFPVGEQIELDVSGRRFIPRSMNVRLSKSKVDAIPRVGGGECSAWRSKPARTAW